MEKIHKFKKEVLTLNIYSQINYYPGNPYYIGKDRDERLKKSIEESNYKEFISEKNHSLYKELITTDSIFHYYVGLIDDTTLSNIYDEVMFSIARYSLVDLKVAFDLLGSYNYDAFFEELVLLNQKFLNAETTKEDEQRFKAVFKKHFGYSIHQSGKITTTFVGSLKREMEKRVDYLETLKEMIEKVIEIKISNEAIAFTRGIGLESFPKNDPSIESLIDCNIERNQVKPLFEFIDFLYFNRAELIGYNAFVGKYERLKMKRKNMSQSKNYKALITQEEIGHKIEAKKVLIHTNITEPINNKAEYLGIYDVLQNDSDCESDMSGINRQKENYTSETPKLIQLYEERYVEFREATNYNEYDCFDLFDGVEYILEPLFSFFSDSGVSKLKVSKDKHLESIRASIIKPSTGDILLPVSSKTNPKKVDTVVVVRETPSANNKKIKPRTKALFIFIDYLYANIDNFNQYDDVLLELDKVNDKVDKLGTHFTEVRKRKVLQKEIDEMWDVVFENILDPLKEIVAELALFNWYNFETLSEIHMSDVLVLSENCDEEDLEVILKAKTQFIEYTYEISSNVINQKPLLYRYLCEVMSVVAEDFKEEGDKPIKNNTMDINYQRIFAIALNYADDPEEMKEFCIRQQKEAAEKHFKEESFYKGLLNVVVKEREKTSYGIVNHNTIVDESFIFVPSGTKYTFEEIDLIEKIIYEICNEGKVQESESLEMSENTIKVSEQLQKVSILFQEAFDKSENPELQNNEDEKPSTFIHIPDHSLKEIKSKEVEEVKKAKERVVNSEKLSTFFKSHFKEEKPINYLCRLVEELKTDRTDKEFGEIALMIHNSEHINDRVPKVFNKWLIIFSNCIDIKKPSYKKGKLINPSHNLRQLFNYL